ncbi:protein of unknown function [Micropruina glycogenica]|uniref:Uncharacterized protein n=1 Tax=Micropruina glycogenica TaxID=75385 RepID=A0A2N9JC86_9ACTN|nr:protein of unknown function [Micropruina glycogenica]
MTHERPGNVQLDAAGPSDLRPGRTSS